MPKKVEPWGDAAANVPWSQLIPPAPGDLRIVQAFVNTFDKDAKTDELTSPRALANWFVRWGLAFDDLSLSNADLEKAIAVREGLRSLIRANSSGKVNPKVVERLDSLAAETAFRMRFEGAGATRLESRIGGLDGALGRLFKIIFFAQIEGRYWHRLKICDSHDCSRAFYDRSTNRTGRWCVKTRCGDRINSRVYRRRRGF